MSKHNRGREPRPSARGTVLVLKLTEIDAFGRGHFVSVQEGDPTLPDVAGFYTAIFTEDPLKESRDG